MRYKKKSKRKGRKKSKNIFIKAVAVDNNTGQKIHNFEGDAKKFEKDFVEPMNLKFL